MPPKKRTLRSRIITYIKNQGDWVASGEIQRLALEAGYTAQNAGRRCREAVEDGILQVEYRKPRNHAFYRYIPQSKTTTDIQLVEENGEMVAKEITRSVMV